MITLLIFVTIHHTLFMNQACDFWGFPTLKRRLAGQKMEDDDEMMWAVKTEFARMCKEGKDGKEGLGFVFDMWEKRE